MPSQCNRRLRGARQLDLFGAPHVTRPATMPTWHQLPETARTTATHLIVRLLVEHVGSDLRSGGGRNDL